MLPRDPVEMNDPLQSLANRDYISEKLAAHRQGIIETYGSSKVPTPVIKDVYKQCGTRFSDQKETPIIEQMKEVATTDFTVDKS